MRIVAAVLCVGLLAFAAGAVHGWVAGYYVGLQGWIFRHILRRDELPPHFIDKD